MAPSADVSNLEEILISDLVDANGKKYMNQNVNHRLMQLSLIPYAQKTHDIEWIDVEHFFKYKKVRAIDKKKKWNGSKKQIKERRYVEVTEKWPADVVLKYQENGKTICEVIEVETISLNEYWIRLNAIKQKVDKVYRSYESRYMNKVYEGVDEIRFSVAINGVNTSDNQLMRTALDLKSRMSLRKKDGAVKVHNLYITRTSLESYCRPDMSALILDEGGVEKWRGPMKSVLSDAFREMKHSKERNIENFYVTVPLS